MQDFAGFCLGGWRWIPLLLHTYNTMHTIYVFKNEQRASYLVIVCRLYVVSLCLPLSSLNIVAAEAHSSVTCHVIHVTGYLAVVGWTSARQEPHPSPPVLYLNSMSLLPSVQETIFLLGALQASALDSEFSIDELPPIRRGTGGKQRQFLVARSRALTGGPSARLLSDQGEGIGDSR